MYVAVLSTLPPGWWPRAKSTQQYCTSPSPRRPCLHNTHLSYTILIAPVQPWLQFVYVIIPQRCYYMYVCTVHVQQLNTPILYPCLTDQARTQPTWKEGYMRQRRGRYRKSIDRGLRYRLVLTLTSLLQSAIYLPKSVCVCVCIQCTPLALVVIKINVTRLFIVQYYFKSRWKHWSAKRSAPNLFYETGPLLRLTIDRNYS